MSSGLTSGSIRRVPRLGLLARFKPLTRVNLGVRQRNYGCVTMSGYTWQIDPHAGGNKISNQVRADTIERLERYAASHFSGQYTRLDIRFRGALCYVDAFVEPDKPSKALLEATGETEKQFVERLRKTPLHLCRLRYFAVDHWSLAFYTYSNERYEPCMFPNDTFFGTPEEGLEVGGIYLRGNTGGS